MRWSWIFPLLLAALPCSAQAVRSRGVASGTRPVPDRPNVLVVVLDDVGVDMISAYGEAPVGAPCTPMIDSLAAGGVLFRHAWADPHCSPTRAEILTGRYGFRTGVGAPVNLGGTKTLVGLPLSETTLAEALDGLGYRTAAFGKWHLGPAMVDPYDPLEQGFQWYEGSIAGTLVPEKPEPGGSGCPQCPVGCQTGKLGYYHWVKDTNGIQTCDFRYATSATVDDALAAAQSGLLAEPWFTYVAFNAIHSPFHEPPSSLCPGFASCACSGVLSTVVLQGKAAMEAADTELSRLIAGLAATTERPTYVLVIGDNGTPSEVAEGATGSCFDPARSKATLYQGGVRVPLIVAGPGIQPGEIDAPVCATDLFATVLQLAGGVSTAEDSISLVPYLQGRAQPLRETVYSEIFLPNGLPFAPMEHERAIRDDEYKLIRRTISGATTDELYDLLTDPCETIDLYPPTPGSPAAMAYHDLDGSLRALGVN